MVANSSAAEGLARLKTLQKEYMKQYVVYDASDRPIQLYQTFTDCPDGGPCTLSTYEYDGTSRRVQKMKESRATWSSDYDI